MKKVLALITITVFAATLLMITVPAVANAQGKAVVETGSATLGAPNKIQPPDEENNEGVVTPDEPEEPQDVPEEPEKPEEPEEPQDTPGDSSEPELPYTAGHSEPYVFLGLLTLLLGTAGMVTCKVIAQKSKT